MKVTAKKSMTRVIALILSVVMVVGMMPAMGLTSISYAESEYYQKAYSAYSDFKAAYNAESMDWDTLIKASYYYKKALEAGDDVEPLEAWYGSHVTKLVLAGKSIKDCTFYDGRDVGSLAVFTGLKVLDLSDTDVTALGALAGLTGLEELDLSGNKELTETGAIAQLSNLVDLNLSDTGFTNNDFGPVAALQNLQILDLSYNKALTAIGPLASLPQLKALNVDRTGLTQLQEVNSFPNILERLSAKNLELTTPQAISGLVQMANRAGAASAVVDWDLTGSIIPNDADGHVAMIQNKLGDKFLPPETGEDKLLAKQKKNAIAELRKYAEDNMDRATDPKDVEIQELKSENEIRDAATKEEVDEALEAGKAAIDQICENDELTRLEETKNWAREYLDEYDPEEYDPEDAETIETAKQEALDAIDAAADERAVASALQDFDDAVKDLVTELDQLKQIALTTLEDVLARVQDIYVPEDVVSAEKIIRNAMKDVLNAETADELFVILDDFDNDLEKLTTIALVDAKEAAIADVDKYYEYRYDKVLEEDLNDLKLKQLEYKMKINSVTASSADPDQEIEDLVREAKQFANTLVGKKRQADAAELAEYKEFAAAYVNGIDAEDYIEEDHEALQDAKDAALPAIEAATSMAAVDEAVEAFETALEDLTTKLDAEKARIQDLINEMAADPDAAVIEADQPKYEKILNEAREAVDKANTIDEIREAMDDFFVEYARLTPQAFADLKEETINNIEQYYADNKDNILDEDQNSAMLNVLENKFAVQTADTITAIDEAYDKAVEFIDSLVQKKADKDAADLFEAKEAATAYVNLFDPEDYVESDKAALLVATALVAIEEAQTLEDVQSYIDAFDQAIEEMETLLSVAQESARDTINEYDPMDYLPADQFEAKTLQENALKAVDEATMVDEVAATVARFEDEMARLQAKKELEEAKEAAKTSMLTAMRENFDKLSEENKEYINLLYSFTLDELNSALTLEDVDTLAGRVEAAIDICLAAQHIDDMQAAEEAETAADDAIDAAAEEMGKVMTAKEASEAAAQDPEADAVAAAEEYKNAVEDFKKKADEAKEKADKAVELAEKAVESAVTEDQKAAAQEILNKAKEDQNVAGVAVESANEELETASEAVEAAKQALENAKAEAKDAMLAALGQNYRNLTPENAEAMNLLYTYSLDELRDAKTIADAESVASRMELVLNICLESQHLDDVEKAEEAAGIAEISKGLADESKVDADEAEAAYDSAKEDSEADAVDAAEDFAAKATEFVEVAGSAVDDAREARDLAEKALASAVTEEEKTAAQEKFDAAQAIYDDVLDMYADAIVQEARAKEAVANAKQALEDAKAEARAAMLASLIENFDKLTPENAETVNYLYASTLDELRDVNTIADAELLADLFDQALNGYLIEQHKDDKKAAEEAEAAADAALDAAAEEMGKVMTAKEASEAAAQDPEADAVAAAEEYKNAAEDFKKKAEEAKEKADKAVELAEKAVESAVTEDQKAAAQEILNKAKDDQNIAGVAVESANEELETASEAVEAANVALENAKAEAKDAMLAALGQNYRKLTPENAEAMNILYSYSLDELRDAKTIADAESVASRMEQVLNMCLELQHLDDVDAAKDAKDEAEAAIQEASDGIDAVIQARLDAQEAAEDPEADAVAAAEAYKKAAEEYKKELEKAKEKADKAVELAEKAVESAVTEDQKAAAQEALNQAKQDQQEVDAAITDADNAIEEATELLAEVEQALQDAKEEAKNRMYVAMTNSYGKLTPENAAAMNKLYTESIDELRDEKTIGGAENLADHLETVLNDYLDAQHTDDMQAAEEAEKAADDALDAAAEEMGKVMTAKEASEAAAQNPAADAVAAAEEYKNAVEDFKKKAEEAKEKANKAVELAEKAVESADPEDEEQVTAAQVLLNKAKDDQNIAGVAVESANEELETADQAVKDAKQAITDARNEAKQAVEQVRVANDENLTPVNKLQAQIDQANTNSAIDASTTKNEVNSNKDDYASKVEELVKKSEQEKAAEAAEKQRVEDKIDNAQNTADTANSKADAANAKADAANTKADNAVATANEAKSTIDKANETANEAKKTANAAKDAVDTATKYVDIDDITPSEATLNDKAKVNKKLNIKASSINTTASIKKKSMKVTWKKVSGATNYRIAYRKAGTKKWTKKWTNGKNKVLIKKLKNYGLYEFKIQTVRRDGTEWTRSNYSKTNYRFFATTKQKLKASGDYIKVKVKKTKKASGFDTVYGLDKKMTERWAKTIKDPLQTTYRLEVLDAGTVHYVKSRPYKNYKGHKYLGAFCKTNAVTTK